MQAKPSRPFFIRNLDAGPLLEAFLVSAVTAVLASFYPAFTVLCARLIAHERQTRTQTAGAVLAVAAVALIAGA